MQVKLNALNKDYLVEFKSDEEFISFTTKFNDKIKNIEIINEDTLPQLQKPVELAKPSKSDGWKALEKSAFTTKEKGVDKKSMELGGGYKEFHYDADKTLASQCDDKVSEPKIDSPALKGEEPKVSDVEATAKENEVEVKDAPKAETSSESSETKSEPAKTEEPKSEPAEKKEEDKSEEPKKEKSDDKEEKKEDDDKKIDEALEDVFKSAGVELNESKVEDDKFVDNYYPFFIYNDPDKNCYYIAEITANEEVKFDSEAIKSFDEAKEQLKKYALDAGIHLPPEDMPDEENKLTEDEDMGIEADTTSDTEITEDAYSTKFGTKSLKEMIDGFVKGEFTLKDLREFMQENNIDPAIVDINSLLQQKDAELDEATKETFISPLADTDKEVEADAENKPSEEFKAELEKNGKLKGDGTDKIEEASDDKFDRLTTHDDGSKWDYDDKFDRLSDLYNNPSDTVKVKVYDIQWDCDGDDPEECGLPNELELNIEHDDDIDLGEEIGDKLSDETGFCHNGFKYDIIKGE